MDVVSILLSTRLTDSTKKHSTEHKLCLAMYGVTSVTVTAILLPLLGSVAVVLRFYTRVHLTSTYVGIDDWLSAFSCLLVLGHGAAPILGMTLRPETSSFELARLNRVCFDPKIVLTYIQGL